MSPLRTILALTLLFSSAVTLPRAQAQAPAARYHPRFQAAACPFKLGQGLVAGKNVRCGYLLVPEDRAAPHSPTIRLAVAIFKSVSPQPAPDPVIFLQGGPGGAIVGQLGPLIDAQGAFILANHRDFILIDQRGTGYSQPSLACRELVALKYRTLNQNLSLRTQEQLQLAAGQQCRARLMGAGVHLDAYTTLADAADISDLRVALGYPAVNLYGVSYGTRLALVTMRAFPQGIRSVVLDSVYALQANLFISPFGSMKRAFDVLFAGCAADRACNRAYPHLASVFYALVARLNARPVAIRATSDTTGKTYTVLLTGDRLTNLLFDALYASSLIPELPAMIAQARGGSYALLSRVYGAVEFDDSVNAGMYYAVECGEDAPFVTPQEVTAAARVLPSQIRPAQLSGSLDDLALCRSWHIKSVSRAQKQPVRSAIPTLVLSAQYDPITPPANGALTAGLLRHSYFFTFPGLGHGLFLAHPCPYTVTLRFLDQPSQRPDASCISRMAGPAFVLPKAQHP